MEARRRHEGFPIISSDHLSGPVRPPPLVAELSLSIIRFSFRFSISPSCSASIICQVLISEQFSAAMLLSWQGETGDDPTSTSGQQKSLGISSHSVVLCYEMFGQYVAAFALLRRPYFS